LTIAAAYLVSDGVVLGGDSSTSVLLETPQGKRVGQLLTNSQKVFEVGNDSRIGFCTWGAGSIGKTSHRTVCARLADQLTNKTNVEEAAQILASIVQPIVQEQKDPLFVGYYLGGWNINDHSPSCFKIEIDKEQKKIEPLQLGMCSFSGNAAYFVRVFWGYDPRLKVDLCNELKNAYSIIKTLIIYLIMLLIKSQNLIVLSKPMPMPMSMTTEDKNTSIKLLFGSWVESGTEDEDLDELYKSRLLQSGLNNE